MKKPLLLLILFYYSAIGFSQINNPDVKRTYHWHFGEKAALDFSSGSPVAKTTSEMGYTKFGVASIADTAGILLFYTDGRDVWNKNNQIMPNGFGLEAGPGVGVSQQALIVPRPLHDSIYYIFHLYIDGAIDSVTYKYSVVNMKLNNGLGDVIQKNITLLSSKTGNILPNVKQNATRHKNGIDYWVLINQVFTNNYLAYKVTSQGVDHTPVISSAGTPDIQSFENFSFRKKDCYREST
jgi:hypothetical protein